MRPKHLDLFFIALLPPLEVQQQVTQFKLELRDRIGCRHALKSPPHITLFPPFQYPQDQRPQLDGLQQFCQNQAPVPITLKGFGHFKSRVIYVHPLKSPELLTVYDQLQSFLKQTLQLIDPMASRRNFAPHMTIALRDLKRDRFSAAWALFQDRAFHATFTATHLTLLKHHGHGWKIDQEWLFPLAS